MSRYERVNSKRKFIIVAEIVFLLKKIYKRDVPLRAMFNVKPLAVLFSPYPREMKTNTAKFKSRTIWARVGMGYTISKETSERQNGGRFKVRGVCFHFPGIRRKQNS